MPVPLSSDDDRPVCDRARRLNAATRRAGVEYREDVPAVRARAHKMPSPSCDPRTGQDKPTLPRPYLEQKRLPGPPRRQTGDPHAIERRTRRALPSERGEREVSVARPCGCLLRPRCSRASRGGNATDLLGFVAHASFPRGFGRAGSLCDRVGARGRLHALRLGRGHVAVGALRQPDGACCRHGDREQGKTGCHRPAPTRGVLCPLNCSDHRYKGFGRRSPSWRFVCRRSLCKVKVRAGEGGFRRAFPLEGLEEIRQRDVIRPEVLARRRCHDGVDEDELWTQRLRHVEGIVGSLVDGQEPGGTGCAMLELMETARMQANSWPRATSGWTFE